MAISKGLQNELGDGPSLYKGVSTTPENKKYTQAKPKKAATHKRYWERTGPQGAASRRFDANGAPLAFHADGSDLDPDRLNVVGEEGPELIPGDSNKVIPLTDSPLGSALTKPSPQGNANSAEQDSQRAQIAQDKKTAATKNDLVGLGMANIHEKELDKAQAPDVPTTALGNPMPQVGSLGSVRTPVYGGPGKAVAQGDLIPAKDEAHDSLEYKRAQLRQQMLSPDLEVSGTARRQLSELDAQNPWGSAGNHPGALGRIAHGLSTAANVAGEIFAPATTALIPGTDLNRIAQENRGEEEQKLGSVLKFQNAETAKELAAANPRPKLLTGDNDTRTNGATGQREQAYEMPDGTKQWAPEGQLPGAVAPQAIVGQSHPQYVYGNKPSDETKQPVGAQGTQRHNQELATLTAGMSPDEKQQFLSAYSVAPDDTLAVQTKRLDGARAAAALSGGERDRRLARDQQQKNHEEALAAIAANRALAEGHKDKAEDMKVRQEIAKIYSDPLQSAERYNIMTGNLKDALPESQGGHNDQQAMLSLLANHLGMTMGLQKGARLNQAIIDEAAKSQPWISKIGAKFDKDGYLSGLTLGSEQMKSMVNLARERYREDVSRARNIAKYAGAEPGDDGPDRTPNRSTRDYYRQLAGGDNNKAQKLAAEDGWTVPTEKK